MARVWSRVWFADKPAASFSRVSAKAGGAGEPVAVNAPERLESDDFFQADSDFSDQYAAEG